MPTAEIITIGTELLLGETVDTNTRYIARTLRDHGIDIFRTSTIGDNLERIASIIREGHQRADIIITTGGLGPTVDDPTRDAIALGVGAETEFRPELWDQIQERFQRYGHLPTENNKRQAYIPEGAIAIENIVGTAPAFIVEKDNKSIIALPGVPREMEYLMEHKVIPYLKGKFKLQSVIKTRQIHTSGLGESQIDAQIGDLEQLHNPTVGLAAHAGQVDIRITAKADDESEADQMIRNVESEINHRLGKWIYGVDDDTLEGIVLQKIADHGWTLSVVEAGINGRLIRKLAKIGSSFIGGEVLSSSQTKEDLPTLVKSTRFSKKTDIGLGVILSPGEFQQTVHVFYISPKNERTITKTYGGPPQLAPTWSMNICLNLIKNSLENME